MVLEHPPGPKIIYEFYYHCLKEDFEDGRVGVGEQDDGEEGADAAVEHGRADVGHGVAGALVAVPCKEQKLTENSGNLPICNQILSSLHQFPINFRKFLKISFSWWLFWARLWGM